MPRLSRSLAAAAALTLATAIAAPSALAADTTPPTLTVTAASGALGVAGIYNSGSSVSFGGNTSTHWTVAGPNITARSNETGTMRFTWRDGSTGQLKAYVILPTTANVGLNLPAGDDSRGSIFPVTRYDGSGSVSGVRHRLPIFSLQRFDSQAFDAAGNASPVRSVTALVTPDVSLPGWY